MKCVKVCKVADSYLLPLYFRFALAWLEVTDVTVRFSVCRQRSAW